MDLAGGGHQRVMLVFSMLMLVFTTLQEEKRNMSLINENEMDLAGEGHQHIRHNMSKVRSPTNVVRDSTNFRGDSKI